MVFECKLQDMLDSAKLPLTEVIQTHIQSKFPSVDFMPAIVSDFGRSAVVEALKVVLPASDTFKTGFDKTFDALDDYTKALCSSAQRMVGNINRSEKLEKSIKSIAEISETDLVLFCANSRSKSPYIREIARRIDQSITLVDEIFKQREDLGNIALNAWLFAKSDNETYRASCSIMRTIIPNLNDSDGAKNTINPLKDLLALLEPDDRADLLSLLCQKDDLDNIIKGSGSLTVLASVLSSFKIIENVEHFEKLLASVLEMYDKQMGSLRGLVPFDRVNSLINEALDKSSKLNINVKLSLALASLSQSIPKLDDVYHARPDLSTTHYLDVIYASTDHNSKPHADLAARAAKEYGITIDDVVKRADKHWKLEMVESLVDKRKVIEKSSLHQRAEFFGGDLGI